MDLDMDVDLDLDMTLDMDMDLHLDLHLDMDLDMDLDMGPHGWGWGFVRFQSGKVLKRKPSIPSNQKDPKSCGEVDMTAPSDSDVNAD
eukprot:180252-Karenia_brevis.AAC.1